VSPIHATSVARFGAGDWRGVLLTGPSGSGKSDMALRLIGGGWRLVSDDYTLVWRSGRAVHATAPTTIVGRIEARGLGVIPCTPRWIARIALVVVCGQETVERMPEPTQIPVAGVILPSIRIDTRAPSSVEIVAAALAQV
jgi:serine kinase of HPr protein (carbohydrate metabolism regulator)